MSGAARVRVKLVLGEFYRRWRRGPIFLGGMHDLRPAPSPENGFAGFGLLASVLHTASSLFLLASFCTLLWRLWTFSELRTCLITDHIHRCYPKLVVRQRCDTSSSWPEKGCAAVILRGGVGIARCGTPSMQ